MDFERGALGETANPRRRVPDGMAFSQWTAPDGWQLRRFDWPQQGASRGKLLLLGGRGDFIEKYLEALAHWHTRGWSLSGFDWRGQGGSGRLLADPRICHLIDFEPLLDDLRSFVAEWRENEHDGPQVVVAHSMGGHLALRLLAENARAFDAAALSSPMLGINVKSLPGRPLDLAARAACMAGLGERRIWRRDPGNIPGRMSSCPERIADKIWWKANHPEIASGSPSWGWTRAAFASIRRLCQSNFQQVDTPILLMCSQNDPIVRANAISAAAKRLNRAELELLSEGGHELLREADDVRLKIFERIDLFFDRALAGE